MTRAERQIVLVLAIVVGLSRLLPVAATLFDSHTDTQWTRDGA